MALFYSVQRCIVKRWGHEHRSVSRWKVSGAHRIYSTQWITRSDFMPFFCDEIYTAPWRPIDKLDRTLFVTFDGTRQLGTDHPTSGHSRLTPSRPAQGQIQTIAELVISTSR